MSKEMSKEIKKVLIANRGEIAVRIIRSLKDMGIRSVSICSEVDRESLHARLADECICVGPKLAKDSYLNKIQIINAALVTGCDAVHPGFGFLSENAGFARLCEIYNLKFIGPSSRLIELLGDKDIAKKTMESFGIPVIKGSDGIVENVKDAKKICEEIGLPVILKARSGGGGKGMRIISTLEELEKSFASAKKEAENAFGDGGIYIEKYIENPRHIEVQIMADEFGNVVHLGARDCSIQMNHQKVIEEAPPTAIRPELLEKMYEYSVRASEKIGYTNVGTIEYLVSGDQVFFMEMNTRIQVEHPVTEMITGLDIVKEQIHIAMQKKLNFRQEDISFRGHAIECRINAYDCENGFVPSVGTISALNIPGGYGVRIDGSMYQGAQVLPYYDSMLAKAISHGNSREEAIRIMHRILDEFIVEGVKTNIDFNRRIMEDWDFVENNYSTSYLNGFK